jgi:hypothetical protein
MSTAGLKPWLNTEVYKSQQLKQHTPGTSGEKYREVSGSGSPHKYAVDSTARLANVTQ